MNPQKLRKIRTAILAIWTLIGIGVLVAIAVTDKFGFSKPAITNIVRTFVMGSCILAGYMCGLTQKIKRGSEKSERT